MSLVDLMASHICWKKTLEHVTEGIGKHSLDREAIRRDDLCDLGKWLHGEGRQYEGNDVYEHLLKEHATLHQVASDIIQKLERGDQAGAAAAFSTSIELLCVQIINALCELNSLDELGQFPASAYIACDNECKGRYH